MIERGRMDEERSWFEDAWHEYHVEAHGGLVDHDALRIGCREAGG